MVLTENRNSWNHTIFQAFLATELHSDVADKNPPFTNFESPIPFCRSARTLFIHDALKGSQGFRMALIVTVVYFELQSLKSQFPQFLCDLTLDTSARDYGNPGPHLTQSTGNAVSSIFESPP
jgi:hypothetical protein